MGHGGVVNDGVGDHFGGGPANNKNGMSGVEVEVEAVVVRVLSHHLSISRRCQPRLAGFGYYKLQKYCPPKAPVSDRQITSK
jgi:hypothetical protein